jgi:hypothetical protein
MIDEHMSLFQFSLPPTRWWSTPTATAATTTAAGWRGGGSSLLRKPGAQGLQTRLWTQTGGSTDTEKGPVQYRHKRTQSGTGMLRYSTGMLRYGT